MKEKTRKKIIDDLMTIEEREICETIGRAVTVSVKELALLFMTTSKPAIEFEMYCSEILRLRQINKTLRKKNKELRQ